MVLRLTITLSIDPGPGLIPVEESAPCRVPGAAADRSLWRQLTWPWAEDYDPDAPAPQ